MKKIAVISGIAVMCVSALAQAATSTGNLSVSAIVVATCSVQSSAASLTAGNAASAQQAAQVGVNCSSGTAYTISLDTANGASRQLISDGNQQSVPVYSSISNAQNAAPGTYNDVVGITLSY